MQLLIIVLPAYNEGACIGELLESFGRLIDVEGKPCRIIVVNDGSADDTAKIVRQFEEKIPVELINHPRNLGLAAAMRTGLSRAVAVAGDSDVIITMDGDNTHPAGLMFRMLQLIREGNDLVIASRYCRGAKIKGLSLFRRAMSFCAAILFRMVMPMRGVRDYTCGYRAYNPVLLKKAFGDYGEAFISEKGFSCMVDILLKLRRYEPIVEEVPLILRYDQKKSASKMRVGQTVCATLKLLAKRRLGL